MHPILKRYFKIVLIVGLSMMTVFQKTAALNLDSLEKVLPSKQNSPKEYLRICDDLSWEYASSNFIKSKYYAYAGIKEATHNNKLNMVERLYRNLGYAYFKNRNMDSAFLLFDSARSIAVKIKDVEFIDNVDMGIANLYSVTGKFQQAILLYLNILHHYENKNDKEGIRFIYGNLGVIYRNINNSNLAEKYYLLAEKLSGELHDNWGLTQACQGLMSIYLQNKQYDLAFRYANKTIQSSNKCNDNEDQANAYQALASIYQEYFKDNKKAIQYGLIGLRIANKSSWKLAIAGSLNSLSDLYFYKPDYQKCMDYAMEAINTDTTNQALYERICKNIIRSGIFLNDTTNSIKYFNKYLIISENRTKKELLQFEEESEIKYQTKQKELQISELKKKEQLYYVIVFITIVLLLSLIIIFILFRKRMIQKRQIAEQKNILLEQEKNLIATQSVLVGETTERSRLAKDLHDGLGGILSALKINLYDMKKGMSMEASDVVRFNKALDLLETSTMELRRVSHNLMPESLALFGLKAALTDYCNSFENKVIFHFFGDDIRIDKTVESSVYRIIQELVNNAIKHANAKQINVQLIIEDNRVNISVQDDGIGFDTTKMEALKTSGIKNVYNRVYALKNGQIDFDSSINKGTEITILFEL
jgi:signal transduction histidine kinase